MNIRKALGKVPLGDCHEPWELRAFSFIYLLLAALDFPGGPVVGNLLANAGDTGLI